MNRPRITKCKVENCNFKHYQDGYCQFHFFEAKSQGYLPNKDRKTKSKAKKCDKCCYQMNVTHTTKGCGYALVTGNLRGCPPEKCDKFKQNKKECKK